MSKQGVYVASKTIHAPMWRQARLDGLPINSTWIDEARDKESKSLPDLWLRCIREASTAQALIFYILPGETAKGGLVEVGAALAHDVPVFVVGEPPGTFKHHPLVTLCSGISGAYYLINGLLNLG